MTLVKRTFILFLSAFLLQMLLLLALMYAGYAHSEGQWKALKTAAIEEAAKEILQENLSASLPQDIPISVFDAQGNLVAYNRGAGRGAAHQGYELTSLEEAGSIIGYYSTGQLSFRNNAASRELIDSMVRVLTIGVLLSLAISFFSALYFSRRLSRPAQHISLSLQEMTAGNRSAQADEEGFEEISAIARSVNTLQKRLQQEQVLRTQWAHDIAHDLRTPVSSLKAQLEAMKDGVLPPTSDRMVKTLRELMRMEHLVDDLEMLMKLESPEMHLEKTEIDPQLFIQDLQNRFPNVSAPAHAAEGTITADEQLLYRAISNLITNAQLHGDPEKGIFLEISRTAREVIISVQNYGKPVPEEELPFVFNRLYRGEFARNTPGSGLGLTLARQITELHNGTILLTSSEESGTKAVIAIPQ